MTAIDEAIQNLPPELRSKIYKELVAIKLREKKEAGWTSVHAELARAPYCGLQETVTWVSYCEKCGICLRDSLCKACFRRRRETHYIELAVFDNCPKSFLTPFYRLINLSEPQESLQPPGR